MDAVEIPSDNSLQGHDISAVNSFNDPVIVANDSASVTSASIQATNTAISANATMPDSPARSQRSAPSSPPNVAPTVPTSYPQPNSTNNNNNIDLLDSNDPFLRGYPTTRQGSTGGPHSSDDDHTEPSSSAATGNTGENPAGYVRTNVNLAATSTFGKLIETTKRRLNTTERRKPSSDDDDEDMMESALIYGYLQKLGRNGKWQTRWFETDGECLTYYKSIKRTKLLATLDLAKVGSIVINREDPTGHSFSINISERMYHLRADSKAACKDWVITLNRVKEARMQEGNVKLVMPSSHPPDLLDHNYAPRVVVIANRQRTRAVDDEELQSWENAATWGANPANHPNKNFLPHSNSLARWQKPKTSLTNLATKLMRWARSIRKYGCTDAESAVVLDHHLHPPGHDDVKHSVKPPQAGKSTIIKETLASERSVPGKMQNPVKTIPPVGNDDDEIRHLS